MQKAFLWLGSIAPNLVLMVKPLAVHVSAAFQLAGVDLSNPMVSTCGSGITAAVVTLAAHLLHSEVPLYDVSELT